MLHEQSRLRIMLAELRFDLARARYLARKYNPDQPRVPAGNPDGGQWTGGEGGGAAAPASSSGLVMSDESADPVRPGAQYAQNLPPNAQSTPRVTIDYSRALTGISTIDDTTKVLSQTLARTMEMMNFIPEWTPQVYGTAVHVASGTSVRFQGLQGIGPMDVEHSFLGGDSTDYGAPGSIRTDAVLRNDAGDIIAIYDVKTGGAKLSDARVRQIRDQTRTSASDVLPDFPPVIS